MTTTENGTAPVDQNTRRLIIETPQATRSIALTKGRLMAGGALAAIGLAWVVTSSAGFIVSRLSDDSMRADTTMIEAAYERRITALTDALEHSETQGA